MKLYYSKGACSLAINIVLHELDLPCEFIAVSLKTHTLEKTGEDSYKINPKGAVPSLELDDGTILTENAVIQQYLADTHKATHLLPPVGDIKRYQTLAWLNYASTDLHKGCSPLFNPNVPPEVKDSVFKPTMASHLNYLNDHFAKNEYAMGDHFTLPDSYLFTVLRWMSFLGLPLDTYPHVQRYFECIKARPAVIKAMELEGLKH